MTPGVVTAPKTETGAKPKCDAHKSSGEGGGGGGGGGGSGSSSGGGGGGRDGEGKKSVAVEAQKAQIIRVWEKRQAAFEKRWRLAADGTCNWMLDGLGRANCGRNGVLYSADYVYVARSTTVRYTPHARTSHATDALHMWQWARQWETDGEPDPHGTVQPRAPKLEAKEMDPEVRGSCIPIPQKCWPTEKLWRLGLCAHLYKLDTFITETEERTTYYIGLSNFSSAKFAPHSSPRDPPPPPPVPRPTKPSE